MTEGQLLATSSYFYIKLSLMSRVGFKFLIPVFILLPGLVAAQDTLMHKRTKREERTQRINAIIRQEEEGIVHFTKHTIGGFKMNTDGAGAFLEIGRAQTTTRSLLFQLEIDERKHTKEEKVQNDYSPTAPLIYGKVNYF